MMNNKGFGKFEVLTIIVVLMIIVGLLLYTILGMGDKQKFDTMQISARNFAEAVAGYSDAFTYSTSYYLSEALDDNLLDEIKSPFASKYCDIDESRVDYINTKYYVTLKCDEYLISAENMAKDKYEIYKVSKWSSKKSSDEDQERVVYNCKENDKYLLNEFLEDRAFVHKYNLMFGTNHLNLSDIKRVCQLEEKTQYRKLVSIDEIEKK